MLWIGITGGIASGKSTVCQLLQDLGLAVVNADQIAHDILDRNESTQDQICKIWGPDLKLTKDGRTSIDRQALGRVVFKDPSALAQLEAILHPLIQQEVLKRRDQFKSEGRKIAFYDVPLLFEKNLQDNFDAVVLVYCPRSLQEERLKLRNPHLSSDEIELRLDSQLDIEEKRKGARYIVDNSKGKDELASEVKRLLSRIQLAAK